MSNQIGTATDMEKTRTLISTLLSISTSLRKTVILFKPVFDYSVAHASRACGSSSIDFEIWRGVLLLGGL